MRLVLWVIILCFSASAPALGQGRQGYVLRVQGRLVFIDMGMQDNVQVGAFFQVVRQETIIHPVTGDNLGSMVPLGGIRVVEVFPRLATAEVVDLVKGMTMEVLDQEARQGLIRVQKMEQEQGQTLQARLDKSPDMPPLQATRSVNPDGPIRSLIPALSLRMGSKYNPAVPDSIQLLLSAPSRVLADSTSRAALGNPNKGMNVRFSVDMPLSEKFTVLADVEMGARSMLAVGGRYFPGRLLGFLGSGRNADGQVGEPVLTLKLGRGGRGTGSLPGDVSNRLNARTDSTFLAGLNPAFAQVPLSDSLQTVLTDTLSIMTASLRTEAGDSLKDRAKRGLGFGVGLSLPVTQRFTVRTGMTRFGNIREFTGGLTFYMKTADPRGEDVNPDGALRSMVFGLDGTYDTEVKETYLNLNLKYPLARGYTLGADLLTDFGGFNRFGLSLKGYFMGF
ncbi:MAG: hypothetical protein O2954_09020 [bacterium]|nr:hypothetical protein [bacterium]